MLPIVLTSFVLAVLSSAQRTAGDVVVIAGNSTLTFDSIEANFAPPINGPGVSGILMHGNPADACSSLGSLPTITLEGSSSLILLTLRGNCSFETKVRNAQDAAFSAVIVYANEYGSGLVTMAGNPEGIYIHAVFVTRETGETLTKYTEDMDLEIWISPSYENPIWSFKVLSFISVLAIAAALATWFIAKCHRIRHLHSRLSRQQEPCVMSSRTVKAMPSVTYKVVGNNKKAAQDACAICLEEYKANENLRILPCSHRFHSTCVDTWLTTWRATCPICKCDACFDSPGLKALETTPLLTSTFSGRPVSLREGERMQATSSLESPPQPNSLGIPNYLQNVPNSSCHNLKSSCGSPCMEIHSANSLKISNSSCSLEAFSVSCYSSTSFSPSPSPLLSGVRAGPSLPVVDSSSAISSPLPLSACSQE